MRQTILGGYVFGCGSTIISFIILGNYSLKQQITGAADYLAMYQKNGQPAEKILRYYFQARFVRPKVRPYQTRNYYALLVKGDDAHDSVSEKE